MKLANVLSILSVILTTLISPSIFGQGSISLDHIDGLATDQILAVEQDITFYLRVTNNTGSDISGVTNGFRIYSPEGAEWTTTTPDTLGTLGRTQFDGFFFINTFSIDGQGADTVGFGGTRLMGSGMPDGFDDVAYTITLGPIAAEYTGQRICLDSSYYPPISVWLWASPGLDLIPDWDGPHCYWIGEEGDCWIDLQTSITGGMAFAGADVSIDWETECLVDMKLEYTVDGGATWLAIPGAESIDPSITSFNWVLPDSPSENAGVRICCVDESACAESEGFEISASGYILVPDMVGSIQDAIDFAQDDWTIEVGPGTYTENIVFGGKAINLVSTDGRGQTFIEPAEGRLPVVTFENGEDHGSIIDGFTLQNTTAAPGIHCDNSSPIIQNCEIRFCANDLDGGGIWLGNTQAIVRNNLIHDNSAGFNASGGGIGGLGTYPVEISYNEIFDNQATNGSGIGFVEPTTDGIFHHNLIRGNTGAGEFAGGIYIIGGGCHIYNNTIVENSRGIMMPFTQSTTIMNNIIVLNTIAALEVTGAAIDYNDVWNNGGYYYAGEHGITEDPMFVDPSQNNFGIATGSPCLDAGNPDAFYDDPDGTVSDIGAYYSVRDWPVAVNPRVVDEDRLHVVNHTPFMTWTYLDPDAEQVAYQLEVGTDDDWASAEMWSTGEITSTEAMVQYAGAELIDGETYSMRVQVNNGVKWGGWLATTFRMNTAPTAPVPASPVDDELVYPYFVRLIVNNSADGESDEILYDFEIYLDEELTQLEAIASEIGEQDGQTATTHFSGLTEDARYFWRARACDLVECSPWTDPQSFILDSESGISVPGDFPTIQAAINSVESGAQILVAPGTYPESINYGGKMLTLRSTHGRELTIISGDGSGDPTVTFLFGEGYVSVLDGFTVQNGSGLGILCEGAGPIVENCDISSCISDGDGAGIYLDNSDAIIRNNYIHHNRGRLTGGGVGGRGLCAAEIAYNTIVDNEATHGSGIGFITGTSGLYVHHNLIARNTGDGGFAGGIYIGGSNCRIINNTITENSRGIKLVDGSQIDIRNNIIASNVQEGLLKGMAVAFYNDVWNNGNSNIPGDNGISEDPAFVDPSNDDFTLDSHSPCIDFGDPDEQYMDEDGTRNDMGALPYLTAGLAARQFSIIDEVRLHVINHTPTFDWMIPDASIEQTAFEFEVGTDNEWSISEMWATGEVMSSEMSVEYAGADLLDGESYFARVRVSDGVDWSGWSVKVFRMNSVEGVPSPIYPIEGQTVHIFYAHLSASNGVDLEGDELLYEFEVFTDEELTTRLIQLSGITETQDFTQTASLENLPIDTPLWWRVRTSDGFEHSDWSATANFLTRGPGIIRVPSEVSTIQGGMDAAGEGDIVVVAPGTYFENIDFKGKMLKVSSSGGADLTTIQALNTSLPVVSLISGEPKGAEISGFTIAGSEIGGVFCVGSSPTIIGNIITGNSSSRDNDSPGIDLNNTTGALIKRNVIHGNNADTYGAAIHLEYSNHDDTICHNVIYGNTGYGEIRAIDAISGVEIYNNTISATTYNGISNQSGHQLSARNNIIFFSSPYAMWGNILAEYNCTFNNANDYNFDPGTGNIYQPALFRDTANHDYRLLPASPCIDAGDPSPIYNDVNGTRADIGAISMDMDLPFATMFHVEGEDGLHMVNHTPTFAWTFLDTVGVQVAFEIQVGRDTNWAGVEMWETGVVNSTDQSVVYAGEPLIDGNLYFARTRVSNGELWGSWNVLMIRMNSVEGAPAPKYPVDGQTVHASYVRLSVINVVDLEGDALLYEFEVYTDEELNTRVVHLPGVPETPDSTRSSLLEGLPFDVPLWWRVRTFDGFEYSDWSETATFLSRGPGIIRVPSEVSSIQGGIDAAGDGDIVLVAPGVYTENIEFLGKRIFVRSTDGPELTAIYGAGGNFPTVTFDQLEDHGTRLDGFTIENSSGYGILCNNAGPIIENCEVRNCVHSGDGAGIWLTNSSAIIRNNYIHDNIGDNSGGGVGGRSSQPLEIAHNVISNNVADHGSGIGFVSGSSNLNIHHNLITNNTGSGSYAGGIYVNGTNCQIINNTISGNTRGVKLSGGSGTDIRNNIIVANMYEGLRPRSANYNYNNVIDNGSYNDLGPNGISLDPMFLDPSEGDYTLDARSPCIDAGDPDPMYNDLNGTRADMGAYPVVMELPYPSRFHAEDEDNVHIVNHTPTFVWTFLDTVGVQVAFEIQAGLDTNWTEGESLWETGIVNSTDQTVVYAGEPLIDGNVYFVRARVSNGELWGSWSLLKIRMNSKPSSPIALWPTDAVEVHVNATRLLVENSTDIQSDQLRYEFEIYSDPSLSTMTSGELYVTEQEGETWSGIVNGLISGNSYWWRARASDTYENSEWSATGMFTTRGPGVITVPADIATIQDAIEAAGPLDTVLVAPGSYVENLDYLGKDIVVRSSHGSGVTFIRPEIFHETTIYFGYGTGASGYFGGFTVEMGGQANTVYISEDCSPTIANSVFRNNIPDGSYSGPHVIYSNSDAMITRNIFYLNGGSFVIRVRSSEQVINNSIVGNFAGIESYDAIVLNNTVVNNLYEGVYGGFELLDYNNVWNNGSQNQSGPHGISVDPLFVDPDNYDFSLQETSPCIGAGHPDPMYNDYDGSRNDIGAIPYPPPSTHELVPTTEWVLIYCGEPTVDGDPLQPGDLVHAYDPDGVWCGVDTIGEDAALGFMPIYADDPLTERDEGAEAGDAITFSVNQRKAIAVPALVWTEHNATTEVCSFTGERCVEIDLVEGWNLISWNVEYEDLVVNLIADISDCVDVVIGFEQGALIFDPDLVQFSTLIDVDYTHGYWLRMSCDATLPVCGFFLPSDYGIAVDEGWNLVGYWPEETLPVVDAFASVSGNITAALGYEDGSMIWLPGDLIHSNLTDLIPGAGYWMNASRPGYLYWPGFGGGISKDRPTPLAGSQAPSLSSPRAMFIYGTDLTLDGEPIAAGTAFEVVTDDSVLCGAGIYEDNVLKFTPIYGFDPNSESTVSLPRQSDKLKLVVGGTETGSDLTWQGNGSRVRLSELFSSSSSNVAALPTEFALGENYPNPFNSSTVIRYDIPKASRVTITIYDMLGRRVSRLVDGEMPPGFHQTTWDGTNVQGKPVATGIYFYRIETADFSEAKKMVFLK